MTASLDLDAVYAAIVEQAARLAAAPTALLLRLDGVAQSLRCVASVGATERLTSHRYALDEGMIGAVATGGEAYVSRAEDRDRFLAWTEAEGVRSFVHVPLELGPRRFGVLTVCHPEPDGLDAARLALLEALARPAAAAIANALEFQHERRIASALTRGFIPGTPPELEGFSLGVVYEPVGHEVSGGDVFGVWRLPGGALAVLVGDVSGKGIEVAAASAMVRFFVEARTWDSHDPAAVLAQTNAILRRRLPERGRARHGVSRRHRRRRPALRERRPRPAARRRRRRGARRAPLRAAHDGAAARDRGRHQLRDAASWRSPAGRCCSRARTGSSRRAGGPSTSARSACRRSSPRTPRCCTRRRSSSTPTRRRRRSPMR